MELRKNSPARRKRIAPVSSSGEKRLKDLTSEGTTIVDGGLVTPFDAVLAATAMAATENTFMSTSSNSSCTSAIGRVRAIAPNSTIPEKPPMMAPPRKRTGIGKLSKCDTGEKIEQSTPLEEEEDVLIPSYLPSSSAASASKGQQQPRKTMDKGLRHFSMRVAAKVEESGSTTYNQVADDLVVEIGQEIGSKCDHKNIRRRVYDALNVLMAIDVIEKDRKEIRWLGLPNERDAELKALDEAIGEAERRIKEKRKTLGELVHRLGALKSLIARNSQNNQPPVLHESPGALTNTDSLHLPFILINAPRDCRVHCEMLEDRSQYFFEFDSPFLINEDIELLRLMGMDQFSEEELLDWLPADAISFICHNTYGSSDGNSDSVVVHGCSEPLELLGFDECGVDAVENFLESMPPPSMIGGMTGYSMSDFGPPPPLLMTMSSPVRRTKRGGELSLSTEMPSGLSTSSRLTRPFRQAALGAKIARNC